MGSSWLELGSRNTDEGPQRRIVFTRNFAIGKFEVTLDQYAAFVQAAGYPTASDCYNDRVNHGTWAKDPSGTWRNPGFAQGGNHPVVCVTWDDAQAYVRWLNTKTTGGYRLPSEAEWEYAARAGTTTPWIWGWDGDGGCGYANQADSRASASYPTWTVSRCNDGVLNTAPAGSYKPNGFGLYDMIGNVLEWVNDCYSNTLEAVPANGSSNDIGACAGRVARGGGWTGFPRFLRSAQRTQLIPSYRNNSVGFRVARTLN